MNKITNVLLFKMFFLSVVVSSAQTTYPLYPGQSLALSDGSQVICLQGPIAPPPLPPPPAQVTCTTDLRPSGLLYQASGYDRWEAERNLLKYCISKKQFIEPIEYYCKKDVVRIAICK